MAYTVKFRNTVARDIGASLAHFNAFLNLTGVKTLALRIRQHCSNALAIDDFLFIY